MKDYSRHIELAIPDNIRLGEHADAKLVRSLIASIVVAIEEDDSVWMKGRMAAINSAIVSWDEAEFKPHIAQENEDWGSLQAQIEQNKASAETYKAEADKLRPPSRHDLYRAARDKIKEAEETNKSLPAESRVDTLEFPRGRRYELFGPEGYIGSYDDKTTAERAAFRKWDSADAKEEYAVYDGESDSDEPVFAKKAE